MPWSWVSEGAPRWGERRLLLGLALLAGWTVVGTAGFSLIEGWSLVDSFYMSVITISTVGYGEIHPLSTWGRLFASILIVVGLGIGVYTLTRVGQVILEGELIGGIGRRRMRKELRRLTGHQILCGFGRVARPVAEELAHKGLPFCVIESNPAAESHLQDLGYLYVIDDATSDEALEDTGVGQAQAVLALLPSDADNLYVTVTAKSLNPKVRVIARASDERGMSRLRKAGASDVISPYNLAGHRIVQAAASPTTLRFMDHVFDRHQLEVNLGEEPVEERSEVCGRSIGELRFRSDYGVFVVAIKKADDRMVFNPGPTEVLHAGDVLVVMGHQEKLAAVRRALKTR